MYHRIVRNRVEALFAALNQGNAEPVLEQFADEFEHAFVGDHALGGIRTSLAGTRAWYARLYRLFPDLCFDLRRIEVWGVSWNTLAVIEWSKTNSGTDGVRTQNSGVHIVHLRWGRTTRLVILTDTTKLNETLDRLAAAGQEEALAPPIMDDS